MKVIVIEDNILFCDYICSLLQKADFKTMKAHGLAQAKKMIRGSIHEDDMVLADLRLPDGESTALLKWMRDNGYMHPFIMMTNYEEIHSAVHAMKLGAEDFILKPLVEDKLLPAIRKIKAANDTFSKYNPQIQISAESETKRSIFREKDKTKRSKKESAQHSKSRNKSFVMTSVSAL